MGQGKGPVQRANSGILGKVRDQSRELTVVYGVRWVLRASRTQTVVYGARWVLRASRTQTVVYGARWVLRASRTQTVVYGARWVLRLSREHQMYIWWRDTRHVGTLCDCPLVTGVPVYIIVCISQHRGHSYSQWSYFSDQWSRTTTIQDIRAPGTDQAPPLYQPNVC